MQSGLPIISLCLGFRVKGLGCRFNGFGLSGVGFEGFGFRVEAVRALQGCTGGRVEGPRSQIAVPLVQASLASKSQRLSS